MITRSKEAGPEGNMINESSKKLIKNIKKEIIMKNLFITIAFFAFPALLLAQTSLGFKAGANFSTVSLTDEVKNDFDNNMSIGYQVGGLVDIQFGGMFAVQAEALYVRRGSSFRSKVDVSTVTFLTETVAFDNVGEYSSNVQLDYVDIPIMLKYNFRGRAVSSYVMAGPHINFAVGARLANQTLESANDTETANNNSLNIGTGRNDAIKSSDFGISVGAGLAFELDYGHIVLDARYYLGMSNIANSNDPSAKLNNRSLMVNIGYMFPLGGY